MRLLQLLSLMAVLSTQACITGGTNSGRDVAGNVGGSDPINEGEANEYKRAILKCYKTGGSRIVKIEGRLMCF